LASLYRKKFAKLKIQFELRMRESESLIREQLRIEDLSKRIQEQNEFVFAHYLGSSHILTLL
jgi:hypothetical protein